MSNHFDWKFYTNFYTDIKAANINTEDKALDHYVSHGSLENRKPHLDVEKYLKSSENSGESLFSSIDNDTLSGISRNFIHYLVKDCKIASNAKILEIGCGIACLSLPLIKYVKSGGKYCGIDPDKQCIDWCKHKITPFCDASFKLYNNDEPEIHFPFDDGEFDVVFTGSLFGSIQQESIDKYLSEITRILKKGGQLIFTIFMAHQFQITAKSKKIKTRTRLNKTNGVAFLTNSRNEKAYVHQDALINTSLEKAHFEIKDTIFGNWSDMSNSPIYQDLVSTVKVK
jgi:ubiquinone/menaquinone biosynthesis C-methylase UbiE